MIPVNEPLIAPKAKKYILDCLNTGWVSSGGKYINSFEESFAKYIGIKYAITTTSGTTALHLALAALGIGPGDEVIIPDLTIMSCALAVIYLGATPVLVDVDPQTGNIDPSKIEEKSTKKTKVLMVVHLYGHPADMQKILPIAKKHKLILIEDAAEAHGAEVQLINSKGRKYWQKVGSIGDIGCFSFYGNKIVTTGEGGMITTNNEKIAQKARLLKDLAHSPKLRFFHEVVGYNFRMTNIQAALGLAQLEQIESYLKKKRLMAQKYTKGLIDMTFLQLPTEEPWAKSVYWMYAVLIKKGYKTSRDKFCEMLKQHGIDTRTYFIPLHTQPALKKMGLFKNEKYPVSDDLSKKGFYLPSGLAITNSQIETVIKEINKITK